MGQNTIDVTVNSGWQDLAKKLDLLDTEQFLEMRREGLKNSNRLSRLDNPLVYSSVYPEMLVWDQSKYTDWQEVLLGNTARFTDLQGIVSGGTEAIQYRVGGNYHRENYVFPGENYDQRGGVNLSITGSSSNQKFKVQLNAAHVFNKNIAPPEDFTKYAMNFAPNAPDIYGSNGDLNWAADPYSAEGFGTWYNPFAYLRRPSSQNVNNLTSSGTLSYEILPRLIIKAVGGYTKVSGKSFKINSSMASTDPSFVPFYDSESLRSSTFMNTGTESWSIEPQLSYGVATGESSFDVLLGSSLQNQSTMSDQIQALGFNSDAVMQNLSQATTYQAIGNSSSNYKYNAIFARINYSYGDKYLINLSSRRDGSSRFGPGRQFGNFWSIGTGWVFTQEKLFESLSPVFTFGKLRFSYGTSGNDGIGDYRFFDTYNPVTSILIYRDLKLLTTSGITNPYYGWENVKKIEFGAELGFFKDRLNISAAYFRNRSSDLLGAYQLPSMVGPTSNLTVNQPGLIQTMGWEFLLNSTNITESNFSWNTSLNFGFIRNKLLADNDGDRTRPGLGKPFYGVAGVAIFYGVDPVTGQYQFLGKDGNPTFIPSDAARTQIRTQPIFSGGMSNSFRYQDLVLDIFLQFSKQNGKNYIFQFDSPPGQAYNQPVEVMDRWTQPGDIFPIQRFSGSASNGNPVQEITVTEAYKAVRDQSNAGWVDASFIRLKTISLSYNLSDFAKKKLHLKNLKIFVQGQNVFTWTKFKGTDPETQNPNVLPPLRTITAGIQLTL